MKNNILIIMYFTQTLVIACTCSELLAQIDNKMDVSDIKSDIWSDSTPLICMKDLGSPQRSYMD